MIGSVNAAEFFITVAFAPTFFIELGIAHLSHIGALILAGVVAAPLGAIVVRYLAPRTLMLIVGVVVALLAMVQIWQSFRPTTGV